MPKKQKVNINLKPVKGKGGKKPDPYKSLESAMKQINKSDLTKWRKNLRMKQTIQGMRDVAKSKANAIKAVGTAFAQNFAPTAAAYAYGKASNDANVIAGANQLVAGGKTVKNNSTDIDVDQYGDRRE